MNLWLLLLVMSLATYRLTRLAVEDAFPPVLWVRDRVVGGWRPLTEPEQERLQMNIRTGGPTLGWDQQDIDGVPHRYVRRASWSPFWLAELLSCPWCASGWIAAAVTAGTWAVAGLPVPVLVWLAVWAVGALIAAQEWA
jgi:hypothetical protein